MESHKLILQPAKGMKIFEICIPYLVKKHKLSRIYLFQDCGKYYLMASK